MNIRGLYRCSLGSRGDCLQDLGPSQIRGSLFGVPLVLK